MRISDWSSDVCSSDLNGRVSIEVEPDLANDTQATIASARALWAAVDRPNALVKIPATEEGLAAITAATAEGISVNVTLDRTSVGSGKSVLVRVNLGVGSLL